MSDTTTKDPLDEILDKFSKAHPFADTKAYNLFHAQAKQRLLAWRGREFEKLKAELREYREKYPDADYNDLMGYIAGFQKRPQLKNKGEK